MKKRWDKERIIESIQTERRRLEKNLASLSDTDMLEPGVIGEWSVKDIMAHLFDWEQRFLGWYEAGLRGEVPETPAPGLKWSQLRILNQKVFEKHRDRTLADVKAEFQSSYKRVLDIVGRISEEDMFEVGRFEWTGRENIAGYILANSANHYRWAKTRIRRWMREREEK
ncbi:MAG: ClbS/DfsB family four-helix bundle protein [Candidatus Thorarchaeota archaeon]